MSISSLTMRCCYRGLNIASCSKLRECNPSLFRSFVETDLRPSSLTRAYSSIPFNGKTAYLNFQKASDQVKIELVFSHTLANVFSRLNIQQPSISLDQKWNYLQQHLLNHYNYKLAPFDSANDINNLQILLGLFQKPLVKEAQMINNPTFADYIFTSSEVFWGTTPDIR